MQIIKIGNHRLNLNNFSVLEENSNIIKGITYSQINYDVDRDESDYEIYSIFVKANKNCSRKK